MLCAPSGNDQTERKGRLGLSILASGVPDCVARYGPAKCVPELYQGDLRLPSRGMPGFVLGINSQLIEIDSNRRLSRTVRNLASSNIVVIVLWNVMVRMNIEITTPAMVTIVCYQMIYHMFGTC